MSLFTRAVNDRIDRLIYQNQNLEQKQRFAANCDTLKVSAAVAAFVVPVFAYMLPMIFSTICCAVLALIAYDLFNMADNMGDAAKLSLNGGTPGRARSNADMLFDSTFLAKAIYQRLFA